ncbi:hypothetical protein [Rhodococcus sp. T7]|uniref:hypothetical protein n=1 Tax=Rhodococcus sp. T7 TaxID=627444 RepID=UPI001F1B4DF6|nr:hypothetical protein [Rhodococcus sp. T7]
MSWGGKAHLVVFAGLLACVGGVPAQAQAQVPTGPSAFTPDSTPVVGMNDWSCRPSVAHPVP